MVQKAQIGTENGTEDSSITPQPGPWSSGQFSVITSQVVQVDKSLTYRTILYNPYSYYNIFSSQFHKP